MARNALLGVLPEVFTVAADQSPPLAAVVAVADDLHAPVIDILDHIDRVADPFRCPENLVAYLAAWADLGWLTLPDATASGDGAPVGRPAVARAALASARLRDLIAASADLSARRGTVAGLVRFLELATGTGGFVVEATGEPFEMRVLVPAAASSQRAVVDRIVAVMKPAHVTALVEGA